jgi:hypothetical protein
MHDEHRLVFVEFDAFDGVPIISVFHDEDGDWQFFTTLDPEPANARLVHPSHVLELDAALAELTDMPVGTWAARHGPGQPWHRGVMEEESEAQAPQS